MKKFFLFSLFFLSNFFYAQINLTGDAIYKLDIHGYYSRDKDGCDGDYHDDGLRHIKAFYANGNTSNIFEGRKLNDNVDHSIDYTKHNKITDIETYILIRWATGFNTCNGGPDRRYPKYHISDTCYDFYGNDTESAFYELSIISRPYIKINSGSLPLSLGDEDYLTISLPDNLENQHYRWKYRIGSGAEKFFPSEYNNKPVLHIRGSEFLSPDDFGKTISVWVDPGCGDMVDKLASGIASRDLYLQRRAKILTCHSKQSSCNSSCGPMGGIFCDSDECKACKSNCIKTYANCITNVNNWYSQEYQKLYESIKADYTKTSNVITFTYRKSAPRITNVVTSNSTCFGSNNGEVRVEFDRELIEGETLNLSFSKKNPKTGGYEAAGSYNKYLTSLSEEDRTITGLLPGEYQLKLLGGYKGQATYTEGEGHTIYFTIGEPSPVKFSTTKVNVWCRGGNDGIIELTAEGGQNSYLYQVEYPDGALSGWIPFSQGNKTQLVNLGIGNYKIQVKDTNGCIAKEIIIDDKGNLTPGDEIKEEVTITEPDAPVKIDFIDSKDPTAYGFTDGYIKAQITGGTPYSTGDLYRYTWKHEDGTVWTDVTKETIALNDGWFLTLNGGKAGKYYLTVTDANYDSATDRAGCTIFEAEFTLTQPEPLKAILSIHKNISCNVSNKYGNETDYAPMDGQRDESQDGQLIAEVTGGVKPYIYTWKKQINGVWTTITTQNNNDDFSTAYQLSDGNYAFNVKDANGIILAEYVNNQILQVKDEIFYLNEPEQLTVGFESQSISCSAGNNGYLKANVSGGIAPYAYAWSNGETTQEIHNLIPGVYKVIVTDARGCRVEGNHILSQPGEMEIQQTVVSPTCYQGTDGSISVVVIGGAAPYTYEWNTGENAPALTDLKQGIYTLKITDAGGCIAIKNIEVQDPEEYKIDLGSNRVLCNEQELILDATIQGVSAAYHWTSTNGFTSNSPKVTLKNPGIYTVVATTDSGCIVTAEITISHSNAAIASEFLLATQAYVNEEVILVNVSNPMGQTTEWHVPKNVKIVNKNEYEIALQFSEKGNYPIGLTSVQGECYEYFEKNIIVEESNKLPDPGATDNPFIQEFTLTPNPNNGNFKVLVKLAEESPISLRIFNILGTSVSEEIKLNGNNEYEVIYQLTNLGSNTYIVILETAKGTMVKRMITY